MSQTGLYRFLWSDGARTSGYITDFLDDPDDGLWVAEGDPENPPVAYPLSDPGDGRRWITSYEMVPRGDSL